MSYRKKNLLKNDKISYTIQCKPIDAMTGESVTKTMTWRKPDGMSEREANREVKKNCSRV